MGRTTAAAGSTTSSALVCFPGASVISKRLMTEARPGVAQVCHPRAVCWRWHLAIVNTMIINHLIISTDDDGDLSKMYSLEEKKYS